MLPALLLLAPPRVTLTYVRHGETVANATGRYNARTLNVLSPLGERQVAALTERLKGRSFDAIYVSPSPRALRTIAPYLRATGRRATVWPLLYECCTERPRKPEARGFRFGAPVTIPADLRGLFVVPTGARFPAPKDNGEGLAQVSAAVREFGAMQGRVLLVGHSAMGGLFLRRLDGKARRVENAREIEIGLK